MHDADFVDYLQRACENAPEGKSVYPYVFPIRNATRPPKELSVRAGYYCIDTFTPINRNAFPAAKRAVDCVLTAADQILDGRRIAYALVRPPGIMPNGDRSADSAISATPPSVRTISVRTARSPSSISTITTATDSRTSSTIVPTS